MATSEEVQRQLDNYLKGTGREPDSTEKEDHVPMPLYPEPPERESPLRELTRVEDEKIKEYTIHFTFFREIPGKLWRLLTCPIRRKK